METFCLQHGRETESIFIVGLHLYKNLYQFILFLRFTKTDIDVSPISTTFFVVFEIHSFMANRTPEEEIINVPGQRGMTVHSHFWCYITAHFCAMVSPLSDNDEQRT